MNDTNSLLTLTIQIGNTDDKLSQEDWSEFVEFVTDAITSHAEELQFFGTSPGAAPWQNACWVCGVPCPLRGDLITKLSNAAILFRQDSIAVTEGRTEFLNSDVAQAKLIDALEKEEAREHHAAKSREEEEPSSSVGEQPEEEAHPVNFVKGDEFVDPDGRMLGTVPKAPDDQVSEILEAEKTAHEKPPTAAKREEGITLPNNHNTKPNPVKAGGASYALPV